MDFTRLPIAGVLLASLFSGQSLAVLADHISVNRSHFLLGAQAGYAARNGDLNIDITHPAPGSQISSHVRDHDDTGFIFGFLGGYEWVYDEFLFGIEASIGFQDFGDEKNFAYLDSLTPRNGYSAKAQFEREVVLGLSTRFGYYLAPWISSYMRLGAETSDEIIRFQSSTSGAPAVSVNIEQGRRSARFIGGFGFEFPLLHHTTLRLEYNYSTRGKGASHTVLGSDGMTTFSVNAKPAQHAVNLAFVWNFRPEELVRSSS